MGRYQFCRAVLVVFAALAGHAAMAVPISSTGGIQFTVAKSGQAEVRNFGNSSAL
jgi:hypothetical protein